jgi:hypothetical protein
MTSTEPRPSFVENLRHGFRTGGLLGIVAYLLIGFLQGLRGVELVFSAVVSGVFYGTLTGLLLATLLHLIYRRSEGLPLDLPRIRMSSLILAFIALVFITGAIIWQVVNPEAQLPTRLAFGLGSLFGALSARFGRAE